MKTRFLKFILIAVYLVLSNCLPGTQAVGQTPLQGFSPPPNSTSSTYSSAVSPRPNPRSADKQSLKQAEQAAAGEFPAMERLGGGQIQEAWNKSKLNEGVYYATTCRGCVVKIRTREFMVSYVKVPPKEHIKSVDIGDPSAFDVQLRGTQTLAIRPLLFGTDSNIIVLTQAGTTYPIYVRAESYNSAFVPDLVTYLPPWRLEEASAPKTNDPQTNTSQNTSSLSGFEQSTSDNDGDFVKSVPFDVGRLHGWEDYEVWGNNKSYKPARIFKDDYFTYIQWDDWPALELPTAYVTIDGIDEVVNTRLQGETYIIESTANRITLKSGEVYVCIQYNDPGQKDNDTVF